MEALRRRENVRFAVLLFPRLAGPVIIRQLRCLDPAAVERAITPNTRAIIAVHLYGNLAALAELRALAG